MTAAPLSGVRAEPAVLSRELADFLIEFSIALHKNAIYPSGHPLLDQAVTGLESRAVALLSEYRPQLSIGIARRQLVIEGVATDPNHPLLKELAVRLNRHHIGAVRFSNGVTKDELRPFLATLAVDAARMDLPLGLGDPDVLQQWPNVRLFPLSFEQLQLLEEDDGDDDGEGTKQRTTGAALWIGLARATLGDDTEAIKSTDPTVLARAMNDHGRDVAYEQVVVGYLLQIANELKRKSGKEAVALQRRISRLVEQLRPETLERLMDMGGDITQRNKFVLHATAGMSVDAVLDIVKAAANASSQGVSHSMIRMLTKFATHADTGPEPIREPMDGALREHVQRLIGEWTLDDPNPDAYGQALEGMAKADPLYTGEDKFPCEPTRMVSMALEVGAIGDAVWRAVDQMTKEGRLAELLALAEQAPPGWAHDALIERIASPERLAHLLSRQTPADTLTTVVGALGLAAAEPLLDALEFADDRRAEQVMDLLVSVGPEAAAAAMRRLPAARWQTQRLLLQAIGRFPVRPMGYQPLEWALHPDAAVRREAIRQLLRDQVTRDDGVQIALLDGDVATVRSGLAAAMQDCPTSAVPILMSRADDASLPHELRALATRAAASSRSDQVLPWLVQRTLGPKRWFRQTLQDKSDELVAAIEALALFFSDREMAQPVLEIARRSKDDDIRGAARRRSGSQTPVK
ncbi:MAG: hypothetical protein SFW08_06005 [Gemmatimonadaceae bacterium]|nr:hypothetical protein [Gemmatimonadaceae bacterium]